MKILKKALALILIFVGGLALNYLVMAAFGALYYEIHGAVYPATALIALAASLGFDCLRRLFRKKLNIEAPVFLLFVYAPSIILCQLLRFEIERISGREGFKRMLIIACVLAAGGLVWLAVSALGERDKIVRVVFAILTCGFVANILVYYASLAAAVFSGILLFYYLTNIALIIGDSALLNFVRKKCQKLHIHGAAVILCAQLPWMAFSLVWFDPAYHGLIPGLLITALAFIIAYEEKVKQRG